MDLKDYQQEARKTSQFKDQRRSLASAIWNLNETVALLSRVYDESDRSPSKSPPPEARYSDKIGDALWYLSTIATSLNLDLDEVANKNLEKCRTRWGDKAHDPPFFDAGFPVDEQFPRTMIFRVSDPKKGTAKFDIKLADGTWMQIGARVTDNSRIDDGYRFHDVLHLGYVAVLGWSPVIRSLMNRKRKSNPTIDEVEDGARAANLEEALTALIYEHAREVEFFKDETTAIPFELLKLVERLTRGLEVHKATYELWNRAILTGYAAWREVVASRKGFLRCNMERRELTFATNDVDL